MLLYTCISISDDNVVCLTPLLLFNYEDSDFSYINLKDKIVLD